MLVVALCNFYCRCCCCCCFLWSFFFFLCKAQNKNRFKRYLCDDDPPWDEFVANYRNSVSEPGRPIKMGDHVILTAAAELYNRRVWVWEIDSIQTDARKKKTHTHTTHHTHRRKKKILFHGFFFFACVCVCVCV